MPRYDAIKNSLYVFSSFGHQTAKLYGVSHGYKCSETEEEQTKVKLGFAVTRQSVHKVIQRFEICVNNNNNDNNNLHLIWLRQTAQPYSIIQYCTTVCHAGQQ